MGTGTSGFGLTQPATGNQGYGQATTSGATATGKNCTVQGQQSLQREHLFKVEDGGTPGADQNTLSRNGWSAPGDRPCGEFVVVPRTPRPSPPPSWSCDGLFSGKFITVQLQSIGAVHGFWDTGSREWGYYLWASGGAKTAQQSTVYAVSGKIISVKLR